MEPIKLSVIVPVYNAEQCIGKCIESILASTVKEIEIIVVNDGSADESGRIIQEYASKDSRVKYIEQENAGVAMARTRGVENANGKYLAFVDSDDWVYPEMYEKLYEFADENNCDIVACGWNNIEATRITKAPIINENMVLSEKIDINNIVANIITGGKTNRYSINGNFWSGLLWNSIYKLDMVKENNITFFSFWNNEDDWYFNIQAYSVANKVGFLKECYYNYLICDESLSHKRRYIGSIYDKRLPGYTYLKNKLQELGYDEKKLKMYCGSLKRKCILFSLYDNTIDKCPLSSKESINYLKSIVSRENECYNKEKELYLDGAYWYERMYMWLLFHDMVSFAYHINKYLIRKYR